MILIIQVFVIIIIVGVIYSLWKTTKAYGGLIGTALKWIGLGMVFFALESLDRVLGPWGFIQAFKFMDPEIAHNIILLMGLLFSAIGFSKLTRITK